MILLHGFALKYRAQVYGDNVHCLSSVKNRDHLNGTPPHRYVPCRVEEV